jgi:hypothetical protein
MHANLGSKQGNVHAAPDLTEDIKTIMDSLARNCVYEVLQGSNGPRIFEDDDAPVVDAYAAGLNSLTWGAKSPLYEHNKTFLTLQKRHRVNPLAKALATESDSTSNSAPATAYTQSAAPDPANEGRCPEDHVETTGIGTLHMRPLLKLRLFVFSQVYRNRQCHFNI